MKIPSLLTTAMFAALLIGAACTQSNTRKPEADAVKQALQQTSRMSPFPMTPTRTPLR